MADKLKFYFTDVFGERKYSGNQLATFMDCGSLSPEHMQHIAREINFSETTFIISNEQKNGGYDVRIFTPGAEVDFAGHPTLGTAFIIHRHIVLQPVEKVVLNLKVGPVPVMLPDKVAGDDILWMRQIEPEFGDIIDVKPMAELLSISKDDIDPGWPIQEVSTGLPFLIVPLKSLEALKKVSVKKELYGEFITNSWAKIILVFSPEGYTTQQNIGVRVFPICYGIAEDPATGSGNGCLAGYLVKNRYFSSPKIDIQTGQGYEIGRPSQLYLRAGDDGGKISINVGGKVIPVAEGYWD